MAKGLFMGGLLASIVNVDNVSSRGPGRVAGVEKTPEQKTAYCKALFNACEPQLLSEIPDLPGKRILGKIQDLQRNFMVTSKKTGSTRELAIIAQRRLNDAE